jgi:SAM-dependent methyltransferase
MAKNYLKIKKGVGRMNILEVGTSKAKRKYPASVVLDKYEEDVDVKADITKPLDDSIGQFDLIHCSYVLEHLTFEENQRAFKNFHKLLKPDGRLHIFVPHASCIKSNFATLDHRTHWVIHSIDYWTGNVTDPYLKRKALFTQEYVKLHWSGANNCRTHILKVPFVKLLYILANLNQRVCERIWCYWVGGVEAVEYMLIKKEVGK